MKKPELGNDVFYTDLHRHARPAKVTYVHHDEQTVDLAIFFPDKLDFRHNIPFDTDHEANSWNWNARKDHAQLEKELLGDPEKKTGIYHPEVKLDRTTVRQIVAQDK